MQSWSTSNFLIKYSTNKFDMEIKGNKKKVALNIYSKDASNVPYEQVFGNIQNIIANNNIRPNILLRTFFDDIKMYPSLISVRPIFIPAGRSFFAYLHKNIYAYLANNELDPFLIEFGYFYESAKDMISTMSIDTHNKLSTKIDRIVQAIVRGHYVRVRDNEYFKHKDGRRTPIQNSSSGQQEMLPLSIILKAIPFLDSKEGLKNVFIEEPEAHLFPNAQKQIVNLMALVYNAMRNNVKLFITTHSPYILTSFNNLMEAGALYKKVDGAKKKKLAKIVPEDMAIDPDDVRAYSLDYDGKLKSIMDEYGLISTNQIDDVSNDLSIEFGKLLDLED
jgi:hypothetical protein